MNGDAQQIYEVLDRCGALFIGDLVSKTNLLKTQVEKALWTLVAAGYLSGDGFGAIRSLTRQKRQEIDRLQQRARRYWGGRRAATKRSGTGRWWLMQIPEDSSPQEERSHDHPGEADTHIDPIAAWASLLLDRYGVFFRDLMTREHAAPYWRQLLPVFRRMEARGAIRGGRFIAGVSGEQFALPEVVPRLREIARGMKKKDLVFISGADPMNLVGIISAGLKVTASASNIVAYRGGLCVGHRKGSERWIDPGLDTETATEVSQGLTQYQTHVKAFKV